MVYSIFYFRLLCRRVYFLTKDEYNEKIDEFLTNKKDYDISLTEGNDYFECRCGKKKKCKCRKTDNGDDINSWANEKHIIEFKLKDNVPTLSYEKTHLFIFQDDDEYDEALRLIDM
jgi:hypothetical protein